MDWIDLAEDGDKWLAFVNPVSNERSGTVKCGDRFE
jgi:hypothetical protein